MRETVYLKDAQNDILQILARAPTDDLLYVDEMDEAFEETFGDFPIIEGADIRLGTFEDVTWDTCPLIAIDRGVDEEASTLVGVDRHTFGARGGRVLRGNNHNHFLGLESSFD